MNKKSEAYNRYTAAREKGEFPYFESDEIEDIAYDLRDDKMDYEALFVLEEGLKMHPGNEDLIKLKTLVLIHFGRYDEARKLFAPYKDDGTQASYMLNFAFEVIEGRCRSALRSLLTSVRKKQKRSIDFVNLVDEMWDKIPDLVKQLYLSQAIDVISDSSEALSRMGSMMMDLQDYGRATVSFEKALDVDAYNIFTWQDLTRCAFEMGDFMKCNEACEFGLAIEPKNPALNFVKGVMLLQSAGYKEAVESFKICRKFLEDDIEHARMIFSDVEVEMHKFMTYDMMGRCYTMLEKTDEAIECYERLIEMNPESHEILCELAKLYLDKGNLPKALEIIDRALKIKRRDITCLTLKVSVLTTMHRFEEAMEVTDKLIKLKPKSLNFIVAKAELALGLQKFEIADQEYRKLLEKKPCHEDIKDLMRQYFTSIGDTDALNQMDNF